jgi:hypothetical protein
LENLRAVDQEVSQAAQEADAVHMPATDATAAAGDSLQPQYEDSKGNASSAYGKFVRNGNELVPENFPPLLVKAYASTVWNLDILQEQLEEMLSLAYTLKEQTPGEKTGLSAHGEHQQMHVQPPQVGARQTEGHR